MSQPERRLSLILLQRCLAGARLTPARERVVALLPWARHLLKHATALVHVMSHRRGSSRMPTATCGPRGRPGPAT